MLTGVGFVDEEEILEKLTVHSCISKTALSAMWCMEIGDYPTEDVATDKRGLLS